MATPDATDLQLAARVLVGFGCSYALGFERGLRHSAAGDRTFSLVGGTAATITAVCVAVAPTALSGVITGVGFVGGGLIIRDEGSGVRGITTAAGVLAVAGIGITAGLGHLVLAAVVTLVTMLVFELRFLPVLRYLDATQWSGRVHLHEGHWRHPHCDEGEHR